MGEVVSKFGWRIYAYCLMGNHYHLLLETPQPNLSRGDEGAGPAVHQEVQLEIRASRVTCFRAATGRRLVLNDNYLIDAASYLLLNPVRAQLVHSPEEWRWSSCAAMAGLAPSPSWLDMDWLPIDYRSAPGDPNGPFLSYVRECVGKPRPANLETQRHHAHRNVKTIVPDTTGVHN